jgi:hypothetical protein
MPASSSARTFVGTCRGLRMLRAACLFLLLTGCSTTNHARPLDTAEPPQQRGVDHRLTTTLAWEPPIGDFTRLNWEYIERRDQKPVPGSTSIQEEEHYAMYRASITGGWLVLTKWIRKRSAFSSAGGVMPALTDGTAAAITFVPDPGHAWVLPGSLGSPLFP